MSKTPTIYIADVAEEAGYRQEIDKQLSVYQPKLRVSHAGKIEAGGNISKTITSFLQQADIILVLISANFLNCEDNQAQIQQIKAIHQNPNAATKVFLVIARPCLWKEGQSGHIPTLLAEGTPPISSHKDTVDICAKIALAVVAEISQTYYQYLPALPDYDTLPDAPFIGLRPFTQAEAPIFFGRTTAIFELYKWLIEEKNVLLFYGQSGVGKSSLLAAGFLPRVLGTAILKEKWKVQYLRREQDEGKGMDKLLRNHVKQLTQSGKNVLIILDQIEEIITQPHPNNSRELRQLIEVIDSYNDINGSEQLRIILSFRKEYFAEVKEAFDQHPNGKIPVDTFFVHPLSIGELLEVVKGVTLEKNPKLYKKYKLQFEPEKDENGKEFPSNLPLQIVHDIAQDEESNRAPALQILMSRMWEQMMQTDRNSPILTKKLYKDQKTKYILQDYINGELTKLHKQTDLQPEVELGLVLDVLEYFTTDLRPATAAEHTQVEVEERYAHIPPSKRKKIIAHLKNSYLLCDPKADNDDDKKQKSLRLGHDSLAPHIQQLFEKSEAMGQKAHSVLEHHFKTYNGTKENKQLPSLNVEQLEWVEQGKQGMRKRSSKEEQLIRESQIKAQKQQKEARRRYWISIGGVFGILSIFLTIIVAFTNNRANQKVISDTLVVEGKRLMDKDSCIAAQQYSEKALLLAPHNETAQDFQKELLPYVSDAIFQNIEGYKLSNDSTQYAAIFQKNKELILWNLQKQQKDTIFQNVYHYEFSSNDSLLVVLQNLDATNYTGELVLYDTHQEKLHNQSFKKMYYSYNYKGYEFRRDDSLLVVLQNYDANNKTGELVLYDTHQEKLHESFKNVYYKHRNNYNHKGYEFRSNDSLLVVLQNYDVNNKTGELVLYDTRQEKQHKTSFKQVFYRGYEFSSNDSLIVVFQNYDATTKTGELVLYDIHQEKLHKTSFKQVCYDYYKGYEFSSNDSLLVVLQNYDATTQTGELVLYDTHQEKLHKTSFKQVYYNYGYEFSSNDSLIVVFQNYDATNKTGELVLYDTRQEKRHKTSFKQVYYSYDYKGYEFSSNDSLLVVLQNYNVTTQTGELVLYDTRQEKQHKTSFKQVYYGYEFSSNDSLLVVLQNYNVTTQTGELVLYDTRQEKQHKTSFKQVYYGYEFSSNDSLLVILQNYDATNYTGELVLYDTRQEKQHKTSFKKVYYKGYEFSSNDSLLVVLQNYDANNYTGELVFYDTQREKLHNKSFKKVYYEGYKFSSNDSLLVVLQNYDANNYTGELVLYDTRQEKQHNKSFKKVYNESYELSSNNSLLVVFQNYDATNKTGELVLYDTRQEKQHKTSFKQVAYKGYEFSSNDSLLVVLQNYDATNKTGELVLYDTQHFKMSRTIQHIAGLAPNTWNNKTNYFLTKDLQYIITRSKDGVLKISNLQFGDDLLDYYNRTLAPLTKEQLEEFGL